MMPNVGAAVSRFERTLEFTIVKKTVVDGDLAESSQLPVVTYFDGTLQPLSPRELLIKPEGERKFKWWTLLTDMELSVDWIVKDQHGFLYRVKNSTDWSDAGFIEYQLIEGPGV